MLQSALIGLMMEKSLRDISVIELTQLADVNRGTFYLHYKDIYDLYDSIESEVVSTFESVIFPSARQGGGFDLNYIISSVFEFISENSKTCIAILKHNDRNFLERIFDMCRDRSLMDWLKLHPGKGELYSYYFSYVTSGCVGLMRTWLDGDMSESPQFMAQMAFSMVSGSLAGGMADTSCACAQTEK